LRREVLTAVPGAAVAAALVTGGGVPGGWHERRAR